MVSWDDYGLTCHRDGTYLDVPSPDFWSCIIFPATAVFTSWPHWGLSNAIMQTSFNY